MPKRVVIIGGGFGGAYAAAELERRTGSDVEIVLLDRNNYFVFYPLLVEAGTGSLHPRHAVVSIRSFQRRGEFRMGNVLEVDTAARRVTYAVPYVEGVQTLDYDQLVVACGSVTRLPPVPGLAQHGHEMKSLSDAVALRDRAVMMLEAAEATSDPERRRALLHFVVVGANFTGVELAGEFFVSLREAARRYRHVREEDCNLTLIEIGDRLLPQLDADLAEFARRDLSDRGVGVRLRTSVAEVREAGVVLSDGSWLPAATVVWTAGIAPSPLLARLGLPRNEHGYLPCDPTLRVSGADGHWAIGDAATVRGPDGTMYAATAQNALRMGVHVARNIARVLAGAAPEPFTFRPRGSIAALGCRTGVAKVLGVKLAGFPAWFLFRTTYLAKMPGFARKVRVAMDWTVDLLFRRDFVQLGVHRETARGTATDAGAPREARVDPSPPVTRPPPAAPQ